MREALLVAIFVVLLMILATEVPVQLVDSHGIVEEYCIEQMHVELDSLPRRAVVYARLYLDSILSRLRKPRIQKELSMDEFSNEIREDLRHKGISADVKSWIKILQDGSVNRSLNWAFAGRECEDCMCVEVKLRIIAEHSLAKVSGRKKFRIRVCHPFRYKAFLEVESLLPKNRSEAIVRGFPSPEEAVMWTRSMELKVVRSTIKELESIKDKAKEEGIGFSYSCEVRSFLRVLKLDCEDLILSRMSVSCQETPFQKITLYTTDGGSPHVVKFVYRTSVNLLLISHVRS